MKPAATTENNVIHNVEICELELSKNNFLYKHFYYFFLRVDFPAMNGNSKNYINLLYLYCNYLKHSKRLNFENSS